MLLFSMQYCCWAPFQLLLRWVSPLVFFVVGRTKVSVWTSFLSSLSFLSACYSNLTFGLNLVQEWAWSKHEASMRQSCGKSAVSMWWAWGDYLFFLFYFVFFFFEWGFCGKRVLSVQQSFMYLCSSLSLGDHAVISLCIAAIFTVLDLAHFSLLVWIHPGTWLRICFPRLSY